MQAACVWCSINHLLISVILIILIILITIIFIIAEAATSPLTVVAVFPALLIRPVLAIVHSLHDPRLCYQAGHMNNAAVTWDARQQGRCTGGPPADRVWFNVAVKTTGERVDVYLDNVLVANPTPYFRPTGRAGVLTLKGFNNVIYFSDIQLRRRPRDAGKLRQTEVQCIQLFSLHYRQ